MVFGLFGKPPPPPPQSTLPPFEQIYVFAGLAAVLLVLLALQRPASKGSVARWLPPAGNTLMGEKRGYEVWVLKYSLVWMASFGAIIAFQLYESFTAATYFYVCGGLAAPLVLRELLPGVAPKQRPFGARHGVRAQLWIAIFGFIGNYWYTHYFYCVLRARYTVPAWRLNNVPTCKLRPLVCHNYTTLGTPAGHAIRHRGRNRRYRRTQCCDNESHVKEKQVTHTNTRPEHHK